MALTISDPVDFFVIGDRQVRIYDVTFDSSYPLGGEAITADDLGFNNSITYINDFVLRDPDTADGAVFGTYDAAAGKLIAFWDDESGANSDFLEVDSTTSLAAYTARIFAVGK